MESSFISAQSLDRQFESSACQVGHTIAGVVRRVQITIANFQNPVKIVKEGSKIHMKMGQSRSQLVILEPFLSGNSGEPAAGPYYR